MNQEDSKGKVKVTKSEEELTQLLEKFEKNIIGNITRGIEIADNFSRESTSGEDQDNSRIDKLQTDKAETVESSIAPKFLSVDSERKRWEFLNPIVLYKNNWMGAKTGGINLDKGTYKIEYSVSAVASKGTGLALFNKDTKKIEKLLFWHLGIINSESIINVCGTQHLAVYSPGIINITNFEGKFNPGDIEAKYIVTVFRLNKYPD